MASLPIPDFNFIDKIRNNKQNNKQYNKYDYISTLGMITSFFTILLVFLLLNINNIWVSLIFVTLTFLILLRHAIPKKKFGTAIAFLIVGLSITIWQYKFNVTNKEHFKEHFYTLFKPYQPYPGEKSFIDNINTVSLSNTTTDLLKVQMKPLSLGYHISDNIITKLIGKLILSRSKILNIQLNPTKSFEQLCDDVNNNKIETALVPAPIAHRCFTEYNNKNLQFLANVQHQYLFCIASIKSGVQNINQLGRRRVGVPPRFRSMWLDIEPFIFPNGNNIKFTFKNEYELFKDLRDYKIDAMFYAGEYPNMFINNILNDISISINKSYQLIPIMFENNKYKHYRKSILKLTYDFLPSRYLPSGLGKYLQTNYTPDFITLGFDLTLICNNKLNNFTGYEIAKTIFDSRKVIIRQTSKNPYIFIGDPFTPADITNPSLPMLSVQEGAKHFYLEKGLISYCKDPICMTTIGNKDVPHVMKITMKITLKVR